MAVTTPFATIEEAIEDIRAGRMVVVVDDEDRENEGDLTVAAQFATPEAINFMATHARGLICLCLTEDRADEMALRPMTDHNEAPLLAGVRPPRDERSENEDDAADPDQVDERLDEHLEADLLAAEPLVD